MNHSVTCILLVTGATDSPDSVLSERTWRKSGHTSKLKPVTGTLTTANRNGLTVLGETEVRLCIENIDCTWPVPLNVKELQSFLGLASCYRRFVSGFSKIAEPLYKLCRKDALYCWQEEQASAFEELKRRPASSPVLAYPDFSPGSGTFILDTEASQHLGIGAVLSQMQPDGTERVIAFGSIVQLGWRCLL